MQVGIPLKGGINGVSNWYYPCLVKDKFEMLEDDLMLFSGQSNALFNVVYERELHNVCGELSAPGGVLSPTTQEPGACLRCLFAYR